MKVYGNNAGASVGTAIVTCMLTEKSLSLLKKLAFSFPASLTCHLPWWYKDLFPWAITVLILLLHCDCSPPWLCRVDLVLVSKPHLLTKSIITLWNALGVALAHLEGKNGYFPPYHILYGTRQGMAEAKSLQQYCRAGSGSCNSLGLLYKGWALHVSKASGDSKEPEWN